MMKFLLFFFLSVVTIHLSAQQKEYVCLPCGYSCDAQTHFGPGTCPACSMTLVEKSTIKFGNLTTEEFCKRIAANPTALILDVRSPEEFNGKTTEVPSFGHFKNAININVVELEQRLGELTQYKDQEILVYCSHSHRSPRASYILSTHGFKTVKNLSGGVSTFVGQESSPYLKKSFVFHD